MTLTANIKFVNVGTSTNLPLKSGKRLFCTNALSIITCLNIGDVKMTEMYYIGVVFVIPVVAPLATPLGFGKITFYDGVTNILVSSGSVGK
jgi:hypothetical protein